MDFYAQWAMAGYMPALEGALKTKSRYFLSFSGFGMHGCFVYSICEINYKDIADPKNTEFESVKVVQEGIPLSPKVVKMEKVANMMEDFIIFSLIPPLFGPLPIPLVLVYIVILIKISFILFLFVFLFYATLFYLSKKWKKESEAERLLWQKRNEDIFEEFLKSKT